MTVIGQKRNAETGSHGAVCGQSAIGRRRLYSYRLMRVSLNYGSHPMIVGATQHSACRKRPSTAHRMPPQRQISVRSARNSASTSTPRYRTVLNLGMTEQDLDGAYCLVLMWHFISTSSPRRKWQSRCEATGELSSPISPIPNHISASSPTASYVKYQADLPCPESAPR